MIRPLASLLIGLWASTLLPHSLVAQNLRELRDISGDWRIRLGDDPAWGKQSLDDRSWERINVPGMWENQGYPGYDGIAWYRTSLTVPPEWNSKVLILELGRIDDIDETYVNGVLIGARGSFPPEYETAYDQERRYTIPPGLLAPGPGNTIAVRVYDSQMEGGIVRGPIRLLEDRDALRIDEGIRGTWKFSTGDDPGWSSPSFDDSRWKPILVPLHWEKQGYRGYDGIAWYRIRFQVTSASANRDMVLLLGKIDDVDMTYLNGRLIGQTGKFHSPGDLRRYEGGEYDQLRAYTIPAGRLVAGKENVLAIRVHDPWRDGGISEGPIGLVTRERFQSWNRRTNRTGASDRWKTGDAFRDFFKGLFR